MARVKGSIKTLDNRVVKEYLKNLESVTDYVSYVNEVPSWIDDCIRGSTGQGGGTTRVSSYKIYNLLSSLDLINTRTVGEALSPVQGATHGKPLQKRSLEYYASISRCASQSIYHRLYRAKLVKTHQGVYTEQANSVERKDMIGEIMTDAILAEICGKHMATDSERAIRKKEILEWIKLKQK